MALSSIGKKTGTRSPTLSKGPAVPLQTFQCTEHHLNILQNLSPEHLQGNQAANHEPTSNSGRLQTPKPPALWRISDPQVCKKLPGCCSRGTSLLAALSYRQSEGYVGDVEDPEVAWSIVERSSALVINIMITVITRFQMRFLKA